jgi:class 3 adenylate cyclase
MDNIERGNYSRKALRVFKLTADAACVAAIGGMLILFGLQFPHAPKLDSLWLVELIRACGDPFLFRLAEALGIVWPSSSISLLPVAAGFAVLLAKQGLDALIVWLADRIEKRFPSPEMADSLSATSSSGGISVSSTTFALAATSEKAKAKILRRHARVARLLSEAKHRRCVFLSIDVVDPNGMKKGMASDPITRSFGAYEEMLEEVFQLTHPWKEAWTPDGVMVCFLEEQPALDAAQRVLRGLKVLNSGRNELSVPFRVRCGLNEGEVVIFEDSRLEKVADHVIDVAGHMQKHARPNSLWLSAELYDRMQEKTGFHPANAHVDGLSVFEWRE